MSAGRVGPGQGPGLPAAACGAAAPAAPRERDAVAGLATIRRGSDTRGRDVQEHTI